ncbi:hypothetical protein [Cellulomonas sp. NPDC089187]|uniref:hypothetical protein n=1 Tax=Cellulomonas sp. NPDC089187 TaxID=3154970 RepID=UPI0034124776
MAYSAFARLIDSSGNESWYDCGVTEDGPERGVLHLQFVDDVFPEWEDGRPIDMIARAVARRAGHAFKTTGAWPENASFMA